MKLTRRQLKKIIKEYFYLPADNVEYTAIILDVTSRNVLMKYVPPEWQPISHHITLIEIIIIVILLWDQDQNAPLKRRERIM